MYPTARGMAAEGTPFRGVLFAGLMIKDGRVRRWMEWNVPLREAKECCSLEPSAGAAAGRELAQGMGAAGSRRARTARAHVVLIRWPAAAASPQAKLLEHNVRFGDPECQSLMVRLGCGLPGWACRAAGLGWAGLCVGCSGPAGLPGGRNE